MRLLLGSNALYYPAHGGGERSNRMLIEALAQRGHSCLVVTRIDRFGVEGEEKLRRELAERDVAVVGGPGFVRYHLNGVEVVVATGTASFRAFFVERKNEFRPHVIITSTDDPAQLLLESALHDETAPTVFLTRATVALPFGPDSAFPSREKTEILRQADGIVGVSEYVARYIREQSGIPAIHVPIALAEPGPHPCVGRFDNRFISMVNPCSVKGISIFVALADAMPHLEFAGVPTWGTTSEDLDLLASRPNITILPKVDDINDLLAQTKVLLVPSVWAEARSRIVVEAMLAGVPVMASNLGGLPEAKMHVPYILPVRGIEGYEQRLNEQFVPIADVPRQDITPWREALERLAGDRQHWEDLSAQSRQTALQYAETATVVPFENYLGTLRRKTREFQTQHIEMPLGQLAKLSPERRKLLEMRLKKQREVSVGNPALPFGQPKSDKLRLFCFAHAGGNAAFFRAWRNLLKPEIEVVPVQYPGHENRRQESFATSMSELVEGLAASLRPALTGKFAFFGHSMGAVAAFELMRTLRRDKGPQPVALIASAARAPQFRLNHQPGPEPSREDLLAQVKTLGGLPGSTFSSVDLLEQLLPALQADTALYRRYCYLPEEPCDVPIVAMGGEQDPHVTGAHLEAWQEQTTQAFTLHRFAGGHFYLISDAEQGLSALKAALSRPSLSTAD